MPAASPLHGIDVPPARRYDVALLDLDGVVYVGRTAVPGAAGYLAEARSAGMRLGFVTNNAARPPEIVAEHLRELGIDADAEEVVTSAQAAAHYLAARLPAAARVLVVGTTGLVEALRERGLDPVERDDETVAAVVQGYSPELTWRQLAEGMLAISRGALWVATNLDRTVPSPRGQLPGNGAMVAALRHASGVEPISTGKPDPTMHRECVERTGARDPLVVGDRLDTDIEGAVAAGCDSLLVLTGVTSATTLLTAPAGARPTYLAADLEGLLVPHPAPVVADSSARCGAWHAEVRANGRLVLGSGTDTGPAAGLGADEGDGGREPGGDTRGNSGADTRGKSGGDTRGDTGGPEADDLDALRALCAAAWSVADGAGAATEPAVTGQDARAHATLERLGLAG